MEHYNRLISAKVLDGYEEMLDKVPQETMFGGTRMRNYVLPTSTGTDYPASLSVGRMDGETPSTLGGEFWKEFGDGFPKGSLQAGSVCGGKMNLGKIAKDAGMAVAKEGIKQGVKSLAKGGKRKGIKPSKVLKTVGKALKIVGKEVAPIAKEVVKDVIVPEGKKALRDYIRSSLKAQPSEAASGEMVVGMGRKKKQGGVLIRDEPDQFHSSVYPPALASYAHSFPAGKDAYGRGRDANPKVVGGARGARAAIVKEVMKKHGLSLGAASKYVKEHDLYKK